MLDSLDLSRRAFLNVTGKLLIIKTFLSVQGSDGELRSHLAEVVALENNKNRTQNVKISLAQLRSREYVT